METLERLEDDLGDSRNTSSKTEEILLEMSSVIRELGHRMRCYDLIPLPVMEQLERQAEGDYEREAVNRVDVKQRVRPRLEEVQRHIDFCNSLTALARDGEDIHQRITDVRADMAVSRHFAPIPEEVARWSAALDAIERDCRGFKFLEAQNRKLYGPGESWRLSAEYQHVLQGKAELLAIVAFNACDILALRARIAEFVRLGDRVRGKRG